MAKKKLTQVQMYAEQTTGVRLSSHEKVCAERMKALQEAINELRKEVKSLKLQRKAKAASDADPTSRKAARLKKRSDKREKRIKKQG